MDSKAASATEVSVKMRGVVLGVTELQHFRE
jgi:hypothetical protein